MARVLLITDGSLGEVLPMFTVAERLHDRGHDIRVIAPEAYRPRVQQPIQFQSLAGNNPEEVHRAYVKTAPGANAWKAARFLVNKLLAPAMPSVDHILQLTESMQWCQLVVGSQMCQAAVHLALHLDRQWITFHPSPAISSRAHAHPVGPLAWHLLPKPAIVNRATHALWTKFITRATQPWCSQFRQKALGLGPLTCRGLERLHDSLPRLVAASRSLFPVNAGWPRHWHMTGYVRDANDEPRALAPELEAFLAAGERPVFLGFASSPVVTESFWTRVVIPALERLGRRAIIGAGWSTLPPEVASSSRLVVKYVSFGDLFPRVLCAVHACGIGTLSEAVWNGAASVCVPLFGEQKLLAVLAYKAGVTPRPVMLKHLDADTLYGLLKAVVEGPQYSAATATFAKRMRAENGLTRACEVIESYL